MRELGKEGIEKRTKKGRKRELEGDEERDREIDRVYLCLCESERARETEREG